MNLRGSEARHALGRIIVHVNARGASADAVSDSLKIVEQAGSADALIRDVARTRAWLSNPAPALALEMALHEETERRAMEGELAALEEMWRQAEEIAAIADRLPDDPPADTQST